MNYPQRSWMSIVVSFISQGDGLKGCQSLPGGFRLTRTRVSLLWSCWSCVCCAGCL